MPGDFTTTSKSLDRRGDRGATRDDRHVTGANLIGGIVEDGQSDIRDACPEEAQSRPAPGQIPRSQCACRSGGVQQRRDRPTACRPVSPSWSATAGNPRLGCNAGRENVDGRSSTMTDGCIPSDNRSGHVSIAIKRSGTACGVRGANNVVKSVAQTCGDTARTTAASRQSARAPR